MCFSGFGGRKERVKGGLDGMAEEAEYRAAKGVTVPCPQVLLGPGPDLQLTGQVSKTYNSLTKLGSQTLSRQVCQTYSSLGV